MRKKHVLIFLILSCSLVYFMNSFALENDGDDKSKVGGFKLPDRAYGLFATARHTNKDAEFTDYVNYAARFSLWVGAVNSRGEVLVTAGTGNDLTRRPEWAPVPESFQKDTEPPFSQVVKISALSYSDEVSFDGHIPLGLQVEQKVYDFRTTGFTVINFAISLHREAGSLTEVYIGWWADIDAPDKDNRNSPANDKIDFALQGNAPFIFDSSIKGNEIPLLGALILGADTPIVSWWRADDDPVGDLQQYAYLKGEAPNTGKQEVGDFRFLVSFGPIALQPGETFNFPVAIAQAPQVSDFRDNLNDAGEFFAEHLGVGSLKKQSNASTFQTATDVLLPQAFQLYPNFPNPFNPETNIQFDLPQAAHVELRIYNALGQLLRTLVNQSYPAGIFTVTWNGRDDKGQHLPSGIYVYRIQAGDFKAQRKLLLLK